MKDTLRWRRFVWAGLLVLVALAYWRGLSAPFVYDDKVEVVGNNTIRVLEQWRAIASYNPARMLLIATYALNYRVAQLDPLPYHVVNLIIHGLAVGAALTMAEAMGRLAGHPRPLGAALLGAGLWAVHPMGAQAVTYITGRSESLCGLFILVSLGLWATALIEERRSGVTDAGTRALALVAGLAALLSKEVGVMLPAGLLALELAFGAPRGDGSAPGLGARLRAVRWGWVLPLGLLVAAAMVMRVKLVGSLIPTEVERPLAVQLLSQAEVWRRYVGLWLLPTGQTLFHVVPDVVPGTSRAWTALGLFGVGLALALAWGRRVPLAGLALGLGALFLIPSSSVAPLKEHMAEHRSYLPGLFLCLAVVWTGAAPRRSAFGRVLPSSSGQGLTATLGVFAMGLLVGLTDARNAVWSREPALWREAVTEAPGSADAWYGLGDAQRFDSQYQDAMESYEKAVELDPNHLDAWNNLGITRAELGDMAGAESAWKKVLRISPSYCKAHNNLGFLAIRQQKWDLALVELNTTLSYCADNALAHWGMGNVYYGPRPDRAKALYHYQKVLDLDATFVHREEVQQRVLELTW